MKTLRVSFVLGVLVATICEIATIGAARAQSAKIDRVGRQAAVHAVLMLSSGENATCRIGNIDDAWVVTLGIADGSGPARYISGTGLGSCVVVPIVAPVGTQISLTGVLQDTAAVPGGTLTNNASAVSEDCFNVEGFSAGLSGGGGSEFDPNDPANTINAPGFGFLWYDSDIDLKPGPYTYTVTGCVGDCPIATAYYNSDTVAGAPTSCKVLVPYPASRAD